MGALIILALIFGVTSAEARSYYFSNHGNDTASGASLEAALKSLNQIPSMRFEPGDEIVLDSDSIFHEGIFLSDKNFATAGGPLVIRSSDAERKSKLLTTKTDGIYLSSVSHVRIENLEIEKDSHDSESYTNGISLVSENTHIVPSDVVFRNLTIHGFRSLASKEMQLHGNGLLLYARKGSSGYSDVLIDGVESFANDYAGIHSDDANYPRKDFRHRRMTLRNSVAHHNEGVARALRHSGSGILISGVDSPVIENSTAYHNGSLNEAPGGGPVGLWVWNVSNALIQNNRSFDNHTNSAADGGGIDVDSDVDGAIVQNNMTYDNDGPGILLCTFAGGGPTENIVVRNNHSRDDAQKNLYGSFTIYGDVWKVLAENNSFVFTAKNKNPSALPIKVFGIDNVMDRSFAYKNNNVGGRSL